MGLDKFWLVEEVVRGNDKKLSANITYDLQDNQFDCYVSKNVDIVEDVKTISRGISFKTVMKIRCFADGIYQRDDFDNIVILDRDGTVLYSREQFIQEGTESGLRVLKFNLLLPGNGGKRPGESESDGDKIDSHAFQSSIIDIQIAQTDYKLFLQPIPLKFLDSADSAKAPWFIGGVVATDTFARRSRRISNHVLLSIILLLSMAFILYPMIKLRLMGARDRARVRDTVFLALSLVFGIPMVIYCIFTLSAYFIDRDNCQWELRELAQNIHEHFMTEIKDARWQLDILVRYREKFLCQKGKTNTPTWENKYLLKELDEMKKLVYPLFDMAFLIDETGLQTHKRIVEDSRIMFHDVSEREYFKKIKNKEYWYVKEMPISLEPVYSKSTGRYELNISIITDGPHYTF